MYVTLRDPGTARRVAPAAWRTRVIQPIRIDSHVHVYPSKQIGEAEKNGYQIWEYGELPDLGVRLPGVHVGALSGTVDELLTAMRVARAHA